MKIQISDTATIREIQRAFSDRFPFLKLEFFSRPHQKGKGSEKKYMKTDDALLKDFRRVHRAGDLIIQPEMRVTELETMFHDNFGLFVQVFRRSGKLWLETTATDSWTLTLQNDQGKELSDSYTS